MRHQAVHAPRAVPQETAIRPCSVAGACTARTLRSALSEGGCVARAGPLSEMEVARDAWRGDIRSTAPSATVPDGRPTPHCPGTVHPLSQTFQRRNGRHIGRCSQSSSGFLEAAGPGHLWGRRRRANAVI